MQNKTVIHLHLCIFALKIDIIGTSSIVAVSAMSGRRLASVIAVTISVIFSHPTTQVSRFFPPSFKFLIE